MTAVSVGQLPKNNPCAQCGKPIPIPSWTEADNNRVHFIWQCKACNDQIQAMRLAANTSTDRSRMAHCFR